MEENIFVVIVTDIYNNDAKSNAILCKSFREALAYARDDAKYYKHLASTYTERIGDNKHHAEIRLYGRYINKTYRISNMVKSGPTTGILENHMNTYTTYDYYDGGILF